MGDLLGVSVEELVSVLKKKHARLPFEIGAFVALEACEALQKGPARVTPSDVRVTDDGVVSVYAPPNSATAGEAAKSVVGVLAHVLVAAGAGVPPVLLDLVEHGPSDGRWDLGRLRDELEASLVPLNRQAARRVLSRMLREARREGSGRTVAQEEAEPNHVDAELDALIGGGDDAETGKLAKPAPVAPNAAAAERSRDAFADDEAPTRERLKVGPTAGEREELTADERPSPMLLGGLPREPGAAAPRPPPPEPPPFRAGPDMESDRPRAWSDPPGDFDVDIREAVSDEPVRTVPPPSRSSKVDRQLAAPATSRADLDLDRLEEGTGKKGSGLLWAIVFLVLIGALVGGVVAFRPDVVDRFLGAPPPEEAAAERLAEERARAQAELNQDHARRFGNLVVRVTPPRAQVLLFVGRGPAISPPLPVGVAHEFIAIADGRSPTRAVVPKDAQWEETDDGPRYELAMQTGDDEMTFDDLVLGETRLPRDMGTPEPTLGTVRVVTNPPGAKVYQLVGFAPDVRIESLRTDEPHELLVWHEGYEPERALVAPSDFREVDGEQVAEVTVDLEEQE